MYKIQFPHGLNLQQFLAQYWQQKPLFMPSAWQGFDNPISPEELAGLAMEAEFPSRIVQQHSQNHWTIRHGPFSEQDFARLDNKNWSLLITDMEKHLPDFMQYVQAFRFIPDWRFDDLMISYAPQGGSVGPHIDDYDVFLLQTSGSREWYLEGFTRDPGNEQDCISGIDLRLIKDYQPEQTILCQPGDILYLPPRIGHHGISQSDDCMTWSFGFKAPSFHNMMIDYLDYFQQQNRHKRYRDYAPVFPQHGGEINHQSIERIKNWLRDQINEHEDSFANWLGHFFSQTLNDHDETEKDSHSVEPLPDEPITIESNPFYKFFFIKLKQGYVLYCDGKAYPVSKKLAEALCSKQVMLIYISDRQDKKVLQQLIAEKKVFLHS